MTRTLDHQSGRLLTKRTALMDPPLPDEFLIIVCQTSNTTILYVDMRVWVVQGERKHQMESDSNCP